MVPYLAAVEYLSEAPLPSYGPTPYFTKPGENTNMTDCITSL
jgi:hypothetical protein